MFNRFKELLNRKELEDMEFYVDRNKSNALHGKILACLVIVIEFIFTIVAIVSNQNLQTKIVFKYNIYISMYLVLIVASIMYLILLKRYNPKQDKKSYHIRYYKFTLIYSYFFLLWGMVITFVDQELYSNLNALFVNMIVVAAFIYLKPKDSSKMFGILAVIFFVGIPIFQLDTGVLVGHYVNGIVVFVFVTLASIVLYLGYSKNYLNERALQEQIKINKRINYKLTMVVQELEKMSVEDSLTGLANRRGLEQFVHTLGKTHLAKDLPLSILMIDIDYFKQYNDTYGHLLGDDVIVRISDVLKTYVTTMNDYAVRFGGEEFLFITIGRPKRTAKYLAENIRKIVQNMEIPHEHSNEKVITISIGLASTNIGNRDWIFEQISNADNALYKAKENGRNQVFEYDELV